MKVPNIKNQAIDTLETNQENKTVADKTVKNTAFLPTAENTQSITDSQNTKKGFDTAEFGKSLIIGLNQTNASTKIALNLRAKPSGADKSNDLRTGIITQLRNEATINTDQNYSRDLNNLAAGIASGKFTLPKGTYRTLNIEIQRLGTTLPNAVPSGKYSGSPQAAHARVQQFDRDLKAIDDNIAAQQQIMNRPFSGNVLERAAQVKAKADATARFAQLNIDKVKMTLDKMGFINDARLNSSRTKDNTVNQAVAEGVDPNRTPVIFVNGFNTDVNRAGLQALELSKTLNSPVNHVVNVSNITAFAKATLGIVGEQGIDSGIRGILGGIPGIVNEGRNFDANLQKSDQRIQQHLVGNRPAAITTANLILDQLYDPKLRKEKAPVKVIGYSQGAPISIQAIRDVESHLTEQVNKGKLTAAEKKEFLGRIRLLGIGAGAAERHIDQKYIDGKREEIPALKDIKYRVIYDRDDPITQIVGVDDPTLNADDLNGRIKTGITGLATGQILPHLSYFKSYEYTDPGSNYNSRANTEINKWFSGENLTGVIDIHR